MSGLIFRIRRLLALLSNQFGSKELKTVFTILACNSNKPSLTGNFTERLFVFTTYLSVRTFYSLGSGKTLAYLAPIVHHLREEEARHGFVARMKRPRACVVVPARELAAQVLVSENTNKQTNKQTNRYGREFLARTKRTRACVVIPE